MIYEVTHIGLTVSDIDKSIAFYQDILGLNFVRCITMSGEATDRLFGGANCVAKVAYLNGSDHAMAPPIELIQFISEDGVKDTPDLRKTSISEICFRVNNIDAVYQDLKAKGVEFLSEPQFFDFRSDGFAQSKAVYFKDPDGIVLELMEYLPVKKTD